MRNYKVIVNPKNKWDISESVTMSITCRLHLCIDRLYISSQFFNLTVHKLFFFEKYQINIFVLYHTDMSVSGYNKLRIDMQDWAGNKRYITYSHFVVTDASDYYR